MGGSDLMLVTPTGAEMNVEGAGGWFVKRFDDAMMLIRVGFKLLMTAGSDVNVGIGLLLMMTGWDMMVDGPGLMLVTKIGSDVTPWVGLLLTTIG